MIPPSEAWLNGHINWSLPQAQQQSSMGLYQSFPSKRGGKARRWTGFHFAMQRRSVPGSVQGLVVNLWLRGLTWRWGMRLIQVARSLLVAVSPPVLLMLGGKGSVEDGTPDVLQSSTSSLSSSAVFQFGMLFRHFDQWRSTTSKRFVLNMVQGHHLQLRSHPALFCNFQQFNVKVAAAHHPIIQKEVDELLAKGAIEPSSGDAGFYSSMFVVPKCTGGLQPILNLKHFNHDMHIPSFRCQLLDMFGSLFSMVIMLSPLICRMLIYIFLLLSIIIISCNLFGTMCLIIGRFYPLGWAQPLGFSLP